MPTAHPRHQVTETEPVHAALETARAAWPDETSPSKLLARLAVEGQRRLLEDPAAQHEQRRRAWAKINQTHPWVQQDDYLETMRKTDWDE